MHSSIHFLGQKKGKNWVNLLVGPCHTNDPFAWHLFKESWQIQRSIQGNFEVPNFPEKLNQWKVVKNCENSTDNENNTKFQTKFNKTKNNVTIWNSSHLRPKFWILETKSEISYISKDFGKSKLETFRWWDNLVFISSKSRVKTTQWRFWKILSII